MGGGGLVAKSCPTLATPWSVARQAPLSMGFSRQEYWSGLPFPSPGDLPDPGIEPRSPTLQAAALPFEPPGCIHTHTHRTDLEKEKPVKSQYMKGRELEREGMKNFLKVGC